MIHDVRGWGAQCDGFTDDTEAVQRALDELTYGTDFGGASLLIPGVSVISDTLTVEGASMRLLSHGWGRGGLKWDGVAGGPMIEFHRCYASRVDGLLFLGDAASPPSVGVSMLQQAGDPNPNSYNQVTRCWFGAWPGGSNDETVTVGVLFAGANANNDKNDVTLSRFSGCTTGVKVANPQHVMNRLSRLHFTSCVTAVHASGSVHADHLTLVKSTGQDLKVDNGAKVSVRGFWSEHASQFAHLRQSCDLVCRDGQVWVQNELNADGVLLDYESDSNGLVTFDNVAFETGQYTNPETWKLVVKASPSGNAQKSLRLVDVDGIAETNLDVAVLNDTTDLRLVEGNVRHRSFRNVVTTSAGVDFDRFDT